MHDNRPRLIILFDVIAEWGMLAAGLLWTAAEIAASARHATADGRDLELWVAAAIRWMPF
jgi:hypothetical protein